jgi:hypothetical protein
MVRARVFASLLAGTIAILGSGCGFDRDINETTEVLSPDAQWRAQKEVEGWPDGLAGGEGFDVKIRIFQSGEKSNESVNTVFKMDDFAADEVLVWRGHRG